MRDVKQGIVCMGKFVMAVIALPKLHVCLIGVISERLIP